MTTRLATGHLVTATVGNILLRAPVSAVEHLVHAWDALRAAKDEPAKRRQNLAYARNRAACVRTCWLADAQQQRAVDAELAEVMKAIEAAE